MLESSNIAFFGTYCRQGRGRGIVVEIGGATYMGRVADLSLGGKK
jgi:sodium/potassium-transporting ATPase subunit alpha